MKKLGRCCKCKKDLFCVDDLNLPENIDCGCSIIKNKKDGRFYVIGEYGSRVFDMDCGIIKDKDLIEVIQKEKKPMICDDCIELMLLHDELVRPIDEINLDNSEEDDWFDMKVHYFNDPSKFRGEELYSLWSTCFEFLLPRLKKFRDWVGDYPHELGSNEKWKEVLGEMIWFVESKLENGHLTGEEERYNKAKKLFFKYFFHLWG